MEKVEKEIKFQKKSIWEHVTEKEKTEIEKISHKYKKFINGAKTERETVSLTEKIARENGFVPLEEIEEKIKKDGKKDLVGKKIYVKNREKNILLAVIGEKLPSQGFKLIASHIDSPRLDLKPNPLIEKEKLAVLKTHYYGGIKKYHFANVPLALHGVIYKKDGKRLEIVIGESEDDPVFTVNDILIHLAKNVQYDRKTPDVIKGEEMNILFSSIPLSPSDNETKKKVKLKALELLNKKYDIIEEDFVSAELEAVPAGKARDVGFDSSMIGGYGQDDRICAFCSLEALLELKNPKETAIVVLADKEEINSEGNTAMGSNFLPWVVARLIALEEEYNDIKLMNAMMSTKAISADVGAAVNPNFPDVHEIQNAPRLGCGIVITKYTGKNGKLSASDANAEYMAKVRNIYNKAGIIWQAATLGKVDEGGGGTIAKFLAKHGIEVIDSGPALLSMHSTFEISSKADLWMSKKAYKVFFNS
ncbi:MAG: aminopeptidase [Candidatus Methanofastidiosia archaeon]